MQIPEGARKPEDRKPSQAAALKPDAQPEGWDLLRPPIDLEFWEITDFLALVAEIKVRGDQVELNTSSMRTIGKIAKILQVEFAVSSATFKQWLKEGSFEDRATKLLPLIFAYASELGEAETSASN